MSARLSVAQCAEFKVNERHIVKDLTKAIEKLSVAETRKRARLMIALQVRFAQLTTCLRSQKMH